MGTTDGDLSTSRSGIGSEEFASFQGRVSGGVKLVGFVFRRSAHLAIAWSSQRRKHGNRVAERPATSLESWPRSVGGLDPAAALPGWVSSLLDG
jgi:hypothetical protein